MKRLLSVLSTLFVLALFGTVPTLAQRGVTTTPDSMRGSRMDMRQGHMMGQGMMQGGMMQMMRGMHQRMMQHPMHRSSMMTFVLPALADTLELADQQVEQINQLKREAMAQRQEHRKQMMTRHQDLMSLFEGGSQPSAEVVRQHLTTMAEMRANQQAAMYETAQAMRQVLTAEQRQMISGMTPQQRMRQMMSHMTMMDMMRMMQSMHGGMMGGGMMQNMPMQQGGMMQHGGMQNMPHQQHRQNQ